MQKDFNDEVFKLPEEGVVELPAEPAEVVEAGEIPAEVGPLLGSTSAAQGVLQVGVHLDLLAEPRRLDLNKRASHGLHARLVVVENYPEQRKSYF